MIYKARLALDKKFEPFKPSPFGHELQITINHSKPEIIQPRSQAEAEAQAKGFAFLTKAAQNKTPEKNFAGECNICFDNIGSRTFLLFPSVGIDLFQDFVLAFGPLSST